MVYSRKDEIAKVRQERRISKISQKLRKLYTGTNYATHNPCTMVDKLVEELEHPESLLEKK